MDSNSNVTHTNRHRTDLNVTHTNRRRTDRKGNAKLVILEFTDLLTDIVLSTSF